MKKLIIILGVLTVSLTSCLKDKPNVDFSNIGAFAELPHSGTIYYSADAITDAGDTVTRDFVINITGQYAPSSNVTVNLAVDNSMISQFNSADLTYEASMPATAFKLSATSVVIKAGTRQATITVTFYKNKLDPSKSYMLPVKIASASGVSLSSNFNAHFFHFIGNDFAGAYTWDYRRWQNGTGPGASNIPPDITGLGRAGTILPISPTEFEMETGYNSNGVKYDVTFTRTVVSTSPLVINYTNWKVTFNAANLAIWAGAGITNMVPPKFTIPPPATNADSKKFELNHTSGGSFARYIDDTYTKK